MYRQATNGGIGDVPTRGAFFRAMLTSIVEPYEASPCTS